MRVFSNILLLALSVGQAVAAEPGDLPGPEGVTDPSLSTGITFEFVEEPEEKVSSFRGTHRWERVGPVGVSDVQGAAVHPVRSDIWALGTASGSAWVTVDEGKSWLEVLAPNRAVAFSDDEEARIGAQALLEDIVESVDEGDEEDPDSLEDAAESAADAMQDAMGQVQSELENGQWIGGQAMGTVPTGVWFTEAGALLVGRTDGLWLSPDLGASWYQVHDQPVTSFVQLSDEFYLLGTLNGLYFSVDGAAWNPAAEFVGVPVGGLVHDQGVYMCTPDGLFHAPLGWMWKGTRATIAPCTVARPIAAARDRDDTSPRALVVGTADTLLRTEDPLTRTGGQVYGGPIPRASAILRIHDQLMLAASPAGPFESIDQGASWQPFTTGLIDPVASSVVASDTTILLGNPGGLYRLVPSDSGPPPAVDIPPWIPLTKLVQTSLNRQEFRESLGSRAGAAVLPELQLTFEHAEQDENRWVADVPDGTYRQYEWYNQGRIRLTWSPNRKRTGSSFEAEDTAVVSSSSGFVLADGSAPLATYSAVSRRGVAYREEVSGEIARLYMSRARLVGEASIAMNDSMLELVTRQLHIQEIEAHLDALSDGAVGQWSLQSGG